MDVQIQPTVQEEAITEEMLAGMELGDEEDEEEEEQPMLLPGVLSGLDRPTKSSLSSALARPTSGRRTGSSVSFLDRAVEKSDGGLEDTHAEEEEDDEITSDEDGDFEFLTDGLNDPEVYDLVRGLIAQCKAQGREAEALQEECRALQEKHRTLLYGAVNNERKRKNRVSTIVRKRESQMKGRDHVPERPAGRAVEIIDEDTDEFEDFSISTRHPFFRFMDPQNVDMRENPYRYSVPKVKGNFTSVFKTGFLFHAIVHSGDKSNAGSSTTSATNTEDGEETWYFFNDSEKYSMLIKYSFSSTSNVRAGPKAIFRKLPSGEKEVEVEVLPEETEILIHGVVNGFRNLSVASPIDASFRNKSVEKRNDMLLSRLDELATEARKKLEDLTAEDVLALCKKKPSSIRFIDPEFPPCHKSIYRVGVDETFVWSVPWRRPQEFVPIEEVDEIRLFRGSVLPEDPFPGDGGDVYLCSAATILAEYPMQVRALFRHPVSVEEGKRERQLHAYRVTLNYGGWWRTVLVDDFLPASTKGPDFGRCELDVRKIWYPVLEKAYAKLYGSYAAIQCGDPIEALQDLTGQPATRLDEEWAAAVGSIKGSSSTPETEKLFSLIEAKLAQNQMVCLSLPDEGPETAASARWGMIFGMSYTVLQAVREDNHRLLQIRCGTISTGCDGKWALGSNEWSRHPKLQKRCHDDSTLHNGVWIDWMEALDMFEGMGVCHARYDLHDYRVRGTFGADGVPSVALEVQTKQAVSGFCVLSQDDDRGYDPNDETGWLTPLMLCVTRSKGGLSNMHEIDRICTTDPEAPSKALSFILGRDVSLRYEFDPQSGPFYIIPRSRANTPGKSYTLGLLLNRLIDNDSLKVRFVKINPTSELFRNKMHFTVDADSTETKYQKRENGILSEMTGSCIHF